MWFVNNKKYTTHITQATYHTHVTHTNSDTAIAKKRPMGDEVYDALRLLGGDAKGDMEVPCVDDGDDDCFF